MSSYVVLVSISKIKANEFIFYFKYLKVNNVSFILNVWQNSRKCI